MKKPTEEALGIVKHIYLFLNEYAPIHLTGSRHTLKSYRTALFLYILFLEEVKGIRNESLKYECFSRANIEEWIRWLVNA
jgi:hypothetical protein